MSHNSYPDAVKRRALRLSLEDGLSATQVAHECGCSVHTVHAWRKQHRQPNAPVTRKPVRRKKSQPTATFIPVNLVDVKSSSVEITTPNGFTVRLVDLSSQSLVELLAALASC